MTISTREPANMVPPRVAPGTTVSRPRSESRANTADGVTGMARAHRASVAMQAPRLRREARQGARDHDGPSRGVRHVVPSYCG